MRLHLHYKVAIVWERRGGQTYSATSSGLLNKKMNDCFGIALVRCIILGVNV